MNRHFERSRPTLLLSRLLLQTCRPAKREISLLLGFQEWPPPRLVARGQNSHRGVHAAEAKAWPGTHSHHQRPSGDAPRAQSLRRIANSISRTSRNPPPPNSAALAESAAPPPETPNSSSPFASLQNFSANSAVWQLNNPSPTKP